MMFFDLFQNTENNFNNQNFYIFLSSIKILQLRIMPFENDFKSQLRFTNSHYLKNILSHIKILNELY